MAEIRKSHRQLSDLERKVLIENGNVAEDWSRITVAEGFDAARVRRCEFIGDVRLGAHSRSLLQHGGLMLPVGCVDATMSDCEIGDDCAIRGVGFLSGYVIAGEVILFQIDQMSANLAKERGDEKQRIWIDVANENAGRRVGIFDGIESGDAFLWSRYRDDIELQRAFIALTEKANSPRRVSQVGKRSVIHGCGTIRETTIGSDASISGAIRIDNLTIGSRSDAPTTIGAGVTLVDGVIGYGCEVTDGVSAHRFVLRTNATLNFGARFIDSYLGDNSTVSCCEIRNSLIFGTHQQHHNNSFLCAATLLGQSNIAAGATIGSNHNSRSNDGEFVAGRGFWPGLNVSFKFSSKVASFCLMTKGSYPSEIDIPFPFSLVATTEERLVIRPAHGFRSNMYSLTRNSWKSEKRDAHLHEYQRYEYDFLAPDTALEMLTSMELLELWVGMSIGEGTAADRDDEAELTLPFGTGAGMPPRVDGSDETRRIGRQFLAASSNELSDRFVVRRSGIERSSRPVEVRGISAAYGLYRDMSLLFAVRSIVNALLPSEATFESVAERFGSGNDATWHNVGGQLMRDDVLRRLLSDISSGSLSDWAQVHRRYQEAGAAYERECAELGVSILCTLHRVAELNREIWMRSKKEAARIQKFVAETTLSSRKKDYTDPFRLMMFDSADEMNAVIGGLDENTFIQSLQQASSDFCSLLETATCAI